MISRARTCAVLFAIVAGVFGASTAQQAAASMTFEQARRGMLMLIATYPCSGWPIQRARVTDTGLELTGSIMTTNSFPHPENRNGTFSIGFNDIESVSRYGWPCGAERTDGADSVQIELKSRQPARHLYILFDSAGPADQFAMYLDWVVAHPEAVSSVADGAVHFHQEASAWRAAAMKPTMPEAAHMHEVLAKDAIEQKNFGKAIDEYEAGLEIFPTWPEGQFNVALICGETGDYDCAVEHMQDYLELVPDAPDALAAKDKLIIWKDKLGQGQDHASTPELTPASAPETKSRKR